MIKEIRVNLTLQQDEVGELIPYEASAEEWEAAMDALNEIYEDIAIRELLKAFPDVEIIYGPNEKKLQAFSDFPEESDEMWKEEEKAELEIGYILADIWGSDELLERFDENISMYEEETW